MLAVNRSRAVEPMDLPFEAHEFAPPPSSAREQAYVSLLFWAAKLTAEQEQGSSATPGFARSVQSYEAAGLAFARGAYPAVVEAWVGEGGERPTVVAGLAAPELYRPKHFAVPEGNQFDPSLETQHRSGVDPFEAEARSALVTWYGEIDSQDAAREAALGRGEPLPFPNLESLNAGYIGAHQAYGEGRFDEVVDGFHRRHRRAESAPGLDQGQLPPPSASAPRQAAEPASAEIPTGPAAPRTPTRPAGNGARGAGSAPLMRRLG